MCAAVEDRPAACRVVAVEADHQRLGQADGLQSPDDAVGDRVACRDPAEDVDEDRLHRRVGEDHRQPVGHDLRGRPAPDVQEVGGPCATAGHRVQGGHHQARAVADDADLAVEPDVVEPLRGGRHLQRVVLRGLVGAPTGLPEARVVVQGDLAVEGQDPALRGTHERVHLDEQRVLADQHLPQPYEDVDGLRRQSGGRGDLLGLGGGDTDRGVDGDPCHRLGPGRGHLLDLRAALGGGDRQEPAGCPVQDVGDVELPVDGDRLGQHHLADRVPLDVHAEDLTCRELCRGRVGGDLHATRLASATGLDLRLHDDLSAEPAGDPPGLLGRVGHLCPRYHDAVFLEEFPCLVFVQVHFGSCLESAARPLDTTHRMRDNKVHTVFVDCMQCTARAFPPLRRDRTPPCPTTPRT